MAVSTIFAFDFAKLAVLISVELNMCLLFFVGVLKKGVGGGITPSTFKSGRYIFPSPVGILRKHILKLKASNIVS